jgi:hypothetical protein
MVTKFVKDNRRILLIVLGAGIVFVAMAAHGHVFDKLVNPAAKAIDSGVSGLVSGGASGAAAPGADFAVNLPPGWRAVTRPDGAVVAHSPDSSSAVVIAPAFGADGISAADWLRQHGAAAIGKFLANPRIESVTPSRSGASMALAALDFDSNGGAGHAAVSCFLPGGTTGTLYLIAAPKVLFAQQRDSLVRVLQSFRFNGQPSGAPSAVPAVSSVSYTSFTDPREGAFSVEVPAGWKIDGGLIRVTAWEYRILLRAVSPDGDTLVRLYDPDLGTFATPTRLMATVGLREGMPYNLYGNHWFIEHYLPGDEFAAQYAAKLARDFQASGVAMKDTSPLPQWDKSGNSYGSEWKIAGGQAAFTCQRNGRAYSGWVAAATQVGSIPSTEGALWYARALVAFLAPSEQAPIADQIAQHMFKSFHMNDQWMAQQSNTAARNGQIVNQAEQKINQIGIDGYWARKAMQDESATRTDEMVRGVVRLRDPNTGEEMEGVAGKDYYYRLPASNNNVGIDRPIVNPDLTEMQIVR